MGLRSFIKAKLFNTVNLLARGVKIQSSKIVIDNFFGRGFGDNPKYIVEQLLKLDPSLDIVWLTEKNVNLKAFPKEIRTVKYYSFQSAYELATARVWIDNVKNNYKGRKKKGQFYLQTWHGGIGFKKVEKAAENTLNEEYINASKADSRQTDLMISNSDWVTKNYRDNFWYTGEIIKTGLPRNDLFFQNLENIKSKVKNFYGINPDTEIILYAPTFRSYTSVKEQAELCTFSTKKVIKAFEKKFGKKFVLIKRMHPNVANKIPIVEGNDLKNGSRYPDMQELLASSFALITDFSSCVFDLILKSNTIFLFARDYDKYIEQDREMLFNVKKDLPFSFSNNEEELLSNISSFNSRIISKKLGLFKEQVGLLEDGHASERVARLLQEKVDSKV